MPEKNNFSKKSRCAEEDKTEAFSIRPAVEWAKEGRWRCEVRCWCWSSSHPYSGASSGSKSQRGAAGPGNEQIHLKQSQLQQLFLTLQKRVAQENFKHSSPTATWNNHRAVENGSNTVREGSDSTQA